MTAEQPAPAPAPSPSTVDEARRGLSGAVRRYYLLGLDTGVPGITIHEPLPIDALEREVGLAIDALVAAVRREEQQEAADLKSQLFRAVELESQRATRAEAALASERTRAELAEQERDRWHREAIQTDAAGQDTRGALLQAEARAEAADRELSALSSDKQTLMTAVTHWQERAEKAEAERTHRERLEGIVEAAMAWSAAQENYRQTDDGDELFYASVKIDEAEDALRAALAAAPGEPQEERQRVKLDGADGLLIARDLRVVAIDGVSGTWGIGDGGPPWRFLDLRDGMYGDFHRLLPASECFDAECAGSGQHVAAAAPGAPDEEDARDGR